MARTPDDRASSTGGKPLAGRVALITGGVRRIGRATALALAGAGADVVINARTSRDEAEATASEVEALGSASMVHLADVTDEAAVAEMTEAVVSRFGRLDILINNAAIRREAAFTAMTYAEWREILAVVLDGAFLCARAAIPHMVRQGGGRIVNVGGVSAHTGAIERAHVSAAKMGLVGLTHALAVEFAPAGITVNCIAPGKIGGKRSATSGSGVSLPHGGKPLVAREGTPEDVAEMILTVCGPAGDFITGQTIHVSGGLYLT